MAGQRLRIIIAKDASRSLASHHGPHFRAGAAEFQPRLPQKCARRFDVFVRNAHDFRAQAHGERYSAIAKALGALGQRLNLPGGEHAARRNHAAGKFFRAPVEQKAHALYARDVLFFYAHVFLSPIGFLL